MALIQIKLKRWNIEKSVAVIALSSYLATIIFKKNICYGKLQYLYSFG